MIPVFIVDDYELVLRGLRCILEAEDDIEVVGEALTATDALTLVPAIQPDVAILDLVLPDGDGIELCRDLRSSMPELKCVMLTAFDSDKALLSATMAGANAYLVKEIKAFGIVSVVRRVAAGKLLLNRELAKHLIARNSKRWSDNRTKWLTTRQLEVLDLITEGMTNKEIGRELLLKQKTVKTYVSDLLSKMGFSNRAEAAVYAVRVAERRGNDIPAMERLQLS